MYINIDDITKQTLTRRLAHNVTISSRRFDVTILKRSIRRRVFENEIQGANWKEYSGTKPETKCKGQRNTAVQTWNKVQGAKEHSW